MGKKHILKSVLDNFKIPVARSVLQLMVDKIESSNSKYVEVEYIPSSKRDYLEYCERTNDNWYEVMAYFNVAWVGDTIVGIKIVATGGEDDIIFPYLVSIHNGYSIPAKQLVDCKGDVVKCSGWSALIGSNAGKFCRELTGSELSTVIFLNGEFYIGNPDGTLDALTVVDDIENNVVEYLLPDSVEDTLVRYGEEYGVKLEELADESTLLGVYAIQELRLIETGIESKPNYSVIKEDYSKVDSEILELEILPGVLDNFEVTVAKLVQLENGESFERKNVPLKEVCKHLADGWKEISSTFLVEYIDKYISKIVQIPVDNNLNITHLDNPLPISRYLGVYIGRDTINGSELPDNELLELKLSYLLNQQLGKFTIMIKGGKVFAVSVNNKAVIIPERRKKLVMSNYEKNKVTKKYPVGGKEANDYFAINYLPNMMKLINSEKFKEANPNIFKLATKYVSRFYKIKEMLNDEK